MKLYSIVRISLVAKFVSDVPCFEHSRVRLRDNPGGGDYIHANYVDGYERVGQYICTQGPLDTTVTDFWRMVWQEKAVVVVMLTKLTELQKVKCSKYFGEEKGQYVFAGPFEIRTESGARTDR